MAKRRVNTRFVVTMAGVLLGLTGVAGGVLAWRYIKNNDPVGQKALADQEFKAGNIKDGLQYLHAAARAAEKKKQLEFAAEICNELAEKYYQTSDVEPQRIREALKQWRRAVVDNPNFKPAQERLVKELYAIVQYTAPRLKLVDAMKMWAEVETETSKLIKLEPQNGMAYLYHAEAVRRQIAGDIPSDKLAVINGDLQKAMQLQPDEVKSFSMMARLMLEQAAAVEVKGGGNALKIRDEAVNLLKEFCQKNPNNAKGWLELAIVQLARMQIDDAVNSCQKAVEIGSKEVEVLIQAGQFMTMLRKYDLAEKYIKMAVAERPSSETYIWQGRLYQNVGRVPEAIEAYDNAIKAKKPTIGIESSKNEEYAAEATLGLCELHMDAAELAGVTSAAGAEQLKEASKYVDIIRGKGTSPIWYFLDGRLNFLRGNAREAVGQLKRADDFFSADLKHPKWRTTKIYLALAYQKLGETGLAMKYLQEILDRSPGDTRVQLVKARIHVQLSEWDKAMRIGEFILKNDPNNEEAKRIVAAVYTGRKEYDAASRVMGDMNSVEAMVNLARLHVINGEMKEAMTVLAKALVMQPDHPQAVGLAAVLYMQMAEKAADKTEGDRMRGEAMKLVDGGLAKNPNQIQLKILKTMLQNPNLKPDELQKKVIDGITDDYERNMALAMYYGGKGDVEKQLEALLQAEGKKPNNGDVIERMFVVAIANKKWDLAQRCIQKAEMINLDGAGGKLFQGQMELARGDKEVAVTTLRTAVTQRPDFSMGRTILAEALLQMGQNSSAKEELEKAIELKPDNVPALKLLIAICIAQGDEASIAAGNNYLKQAKMHAPRDAQLAAYDDLIGDPVDGIRRREMIREKNPEDGENLRRLAVLYAKAKQLDKAIEVLKPVYEKSPDDLRVADALARLYRDAKKPDAALGIYQQFVTNPDPKVQFTALMLLADMYRSLQQTKEAVQIYEQAITKQPQGSTEAERRLADMYFDIDEMAKAETAYKALQEKDAKDLRVLRRYVETLIRQDKFAPADELLNSRILKDRPKDPEGLVLRGYLLLRQRNATEALKCFNTVLETQRNNTDALHYRAFSQFFMQGDLKQATEDLQSVRAIQPNAVNSRLLLARVYRQTRMYLEANNEYREVLKLRPELLQARLEYVDFLFSMAQAFVRTSANDSFTIALRAIKPVETLQALLAESASRYPTQPVWLVRMGDLASLLGNRQGSTELYKKAYGDSDKNPGAAVAYLGSLLSQKQYERLITEATMLLKDRPKFVDLYVKRGSALAGQGKQKEALVDFDTALGLAAESKDMELFLDVVRNIYITLPAEVSVQHLQARLRGDPKNIPTRVGLAQVLLTNGRSTETIEVIKPLLDDPAAANLKVLTIRVLALASYQSKQHEQALKYYQELLKLVPDDLEALNNLAYLLAVDMGKPKDGLLLAEKAIKVLKTRPGELVYVNNGNVMDTYGWVLFLNGNITNAIDELTRSVQADPLPITYLHLAKVLKKQEKLIDAKNMLKKCIELAKDKNDPVLQEAQDELSNLK